MGAMKRLTPTTRRTAAQRSPDEDALLDGLARPAGVRSKATTEPPLAEEAVIMALNEMGLDLAHRIEHDADHDKKTGAAEERGGEIRDAQLMERIWAAVR